MKSSELKAKTRAAKKARKKVALLPKLEREALQGYRKAETTKERYLFRIHNAGQAVYIGDANLPKKDWRSLRETTLNLLGITPKDLGRSTFKNGRSACNDRMNVGYLQYRENTGWWQSFGYESQMTGLTILCLKQN